MKTWLKVVLAVVGALVLVAGGLAFYATRPIAAASYDSTVPVGVRQANSAVLTGLASANITQATAHIVRGEVRVDYALPPDINASDPYTQDQFQQYVLGVVSQVAKTGNATLVQYDGATPKLQWVADLATLQDVLAGKTNETAYLRTVAVTRL